MEATVLPASNVGEFTLTTGQTSIPVTSTAFVTALRPNAHAGAKATVTSGGRGMVPVGASIPSPQ